MKIKILIYVTLLFIISSSCEEAEIYEGDPNDLLIEVNTTFTVIPETRKFLVISNDKSNSKFIELENDNKYRINRGNDFSGDKIHLHIIEYWENLEYWEISSYYEIGLGLKLNLGTDKKIGNSKFAVNLKFKDVPGFEIITRSAMHPGHCHTQTTLDVACSPLNEFGPYNDENRFYACFQNNVGGKYLLKEIPNDATGEFLISFSDLNEDMVKYEFLKSYNNKSLDWIQIFSGNLELYSLENMDIFSGKIIAYIPNLSEFDKFTTYANFDMDEEYSFSFENIGDVPGDFNFINSDLNVSTNGTSLPSIDNVEGIYDFIHGSIRFDNGHWELYSYNKEIPFPKLPSEVNDELLFDQLKNNVKSVFIEVVDYENSTNSYMDFIKDILLGEENVLYGNIKTSKSFSKSM